MTRVKADPTDPIIRTWQNVFPKMFKPMSAMPADLRQHIRYPKDYFLIQADILPALGNRVWDSSAILSDHSYVGQALHTLIGYDARPAGMQLLFYAVTAVAIAIGMRLWGSQVSRSTQRPA